MSYILEKITCPSCEGSGEDGNRCCDSCDGSGEILQRVCESPKDIYEEET